MEEAFLGLFRFFRALGAPAGVALALALADPHLHREGGTIVVEGSLVGAMTPAVRAVVDTGTPVELRYRARLSAPGGTAEGEDAAVLRRDTLTGAFRVERGAVLETFADLEAAAARASTYHIALPDPGPGALELRIEASLHHPPGLDLPSAAAALWDHRTPYLVLHHAERSLP